MGPRGDRGADSQRWVRAWLWIVLLAIVLMVAVGGITRLTESGLSMVDWRPLMGAIPPRDEAEWERVFALYQGSPQYEQVNRGMGLEEFKRIFFWEYVHRLLGRLLGVLFFVPWVVFLVRGRLRGRAAVATFVAFLLGGAQGLLGWYMVKSGLVDVPAVSHFRLSAHLLLAFGTAGWILWVLLELRTAARGGEPLHAPTAFRVAVAGILGVTVLQVLYGAFMAGKDAGLVAPTFPDMNGHYVPGPFFHGPVLHELLHSPLAIHYTHRMLAWLLLALGAGLPVLGRRLGVASSVMRDSFVLLGLLVLQVTLGAVTVLFYVPLHAAVAHQLGAFLLLSWVTVLAYRSGVLPRGRLVPRRS